LAIFVDLFAFSPKKTKKNIFLTLLLIAFFATAKAGYPKKKGITHKRH